MANQVAVTQQTAKAGVNVGQGSSVLLGYGKPFTPTGKQQNNAASWRAIASMLASSNGKGVTGQAVYAMLLARPHGSFYNYVQVRGWLVPMGKSGTITTARGTKYVGHGVQCTAL